MNMFHLQFVEAGAADEQIIRQMAQLIAIQFTVGKQGNILGK